MSLKSIRLGTASPASQPTAQETLARLSEIAQRAAARKIDILLLPEAYVGGYPRGTAFGSVIGNRSAEGRDEYLRYFRAAVDLGDTVGDGGAGAGDAWVRRELEPDAVSGLDQSNPNNDDSSRTVRKRGDGTREELERIARATGVFLVVGCIERAGGSLYCAVVYVCPRLGAIGKRRKVLPTGAERLIWAQGSPATLRAVSTTIRGVRVNLAAAICWENYMPLVRQALYAQNINLYLAPTADGRDTWQALMRTVAIEGRCFVVSSNMCIRAAGSAGPTSNGHEAVQEQEPDAEPAARTRSRRKSSCVTEEGFEIALPSPPLTKTRSNRRRQSVFDADGNEIVLCCDETVPEDSAIDDRPSTSPQPAAAKTKTAALANGQSQPNEFVTRGGSSIISPFGEVLAGPQWEDNEGILHADVDFEDCIRGRLDLDTAGSYSRNDSFRFSVDGLELNPLPY